MDSNWLGSELILKEEALQDIVHQLHSSTLQNIQLSDSYIDIHNFYTAYSVMLLFSGTGHRPVEDPFCYKSDYDIDLGMMLIDDKAVSEKHRFRLVALPEIAVTQLTEYENHLKWLISHLMKENISPNLKNAIFQLLNSDTPRKEQSLPLFFFIKRYKSKFKTYSVTEATLKTQLGSLWPVPYNFSRHNISTQLRQHILHNKDADLSIDEVEAMLGHMSGRHHPFGASGVISPMKFQRNISIPLNHILLEQNWKPIKAKRYHKSLSGISTAQWKHSSGTLGPVSREIERKKRKEKDQQVINQALENYSEKEIIENPSLINKIRESIIKNSSNDEDRIKTRLLLFWKKLIALSKKTSTFKLPRRLHIINNEPSPFNKNTITNYRKAASLRQKFITYLQEEGRKQSQKSDFRINYYRRHAELIISASLFDGIINSDILSILCGSFITLTKEGETIYMDIFESTEGGKQKRNLIYRWHPQPLSISLANSLNSINIASKPNTIINSAKVIREINKIFSFSKDEQKMSILCNYSEAFWKMHMPPFLREIASGSIPVQPLSEATLIKLLRNERNISENNEHTDASSDNSITLYSANAIRDSHNLKNCKEFKQFLKSEIKYAETLQGKNKKSANYIRKEYLAKSLRTVFNKEHSFPTIAVAIGSWAIKLCEKGTDLYGKIAFSTVKDYVSLISNALIETAYKGSFFYLSQEEYDALYDIAFEINTHSDQRKFLNNIKDFHNFLVRAGLAPELDWTTYNQSVNKNKITSTVDANFISYTEYKRALKILYAISQDIKYNKKTLLQYCALLVCGYRFGMRISEALHLQYRHIQHTFDWSEIVINIENTFMADTKSVAGRRSITLIGSLNKIETEIVQAIFDNPLLDTESRDTLIFNVNNNSREIFDTLKASQVLQGVLKRVTGDTYFHFHHLRHSFNTGLYSCIFEINDDLYNKSIFNYEYSHIAPTFIRKILSGKRQISKLSLAAISTISGHSQPKTTLTNYIHNCDHHIYHIAGTKKLWNSFGIKRIDLITSYLSGKNLESTKKQRQRLGIPTDDLFSACKAETYNIKLSNSKIITDKIPELEEDISYMKSILDVDNSENEITIVDIDNILRLICTQIEYDPKIIANHVHKSIADVDKVYNLFKSLKYHTKYLGYICNFDPKPEKSKPIIEKTAETNAVHELLNKIETSFSSFSTNEYKILRESINIWSKAYYPNPRFMPIILDTPTDIMKYLNGMRLIGLRTSNMMITTPSNLLPWCKIRKRTYKNTEIVITTISNETSKHSYIFNLLGDPKRLPKAIGKSRYINNDRVGLAIDKNSHHPIYAQKRLHRICFLLHIYLHL